MGIKGLYVRLVPNQGSSPPKPWGHAVEGVRCLSQACIDDYGEVWINGECDRERGTVQGFNVAQRILITADAQPGEAHPIALLAANGPLAAPRGPVFVRYSNLSFEWQEGQ